MSKRLDVMTTENLRLADVAGRKIGLAAFTLLDCLGGIAEEYADARDATAVLRDMIEKPEMWRRRLAPFVRERK